MNETLNGLIICLALVLLAVLWRALILSRRCRTLKELLEKSIQEEKVVQEKKELQDAMLPSGLLKLFHKGELQKLQIGEERNVQAAVLSFNLPGFSRMIRSMTAEDIFSFVNEVLSQVVPAVLFQEGEVDKFVNGGLSAFYLQSPERALRSAVSICEAINQKKGGDLEYSIGLTYGDVMIGTVGYESRFGVLTISETTSIANYLQELAGRYRSRILISGSLKNEIPDFEKNYNSRYLGCIYLKAADATEDIYEVYDGDAPADKNGKRRTRLIFEEGVQLFQKQRFYDARIHFIEVLKANRMDGAAKEYLYLCNQYQTKKDMSQGTAYLEIY